MKKLWVCWVVVLSMAIAPAKLEAQTGILEIIKIGVTKIIKAVDLKIQRLQNQTIWLQNAQKVLENTMSKLKLSEISNWTQRQKNLYARYFDELGQVKRTIATYQRVRGIIVRQVQLVQESKRAYRLATRDKNFTLQELDAMLEVHSGILLESIKNIDRVQLAISAFALQLSDAKRLALINDASDRMEQDFADLRQFNQENIKISLQRAKEKNDIEVVKKLYGIR